MPAYHQMGHDSENLLWTEELSIYQGAILSPVNYDQAKVAAQVVWARDRDKFDCIFDPQLYVPNSERGCLREWNYFPTDVDTADLDSDAWWNTLLDRLIEECNAVSPNALCSPAVLPSTYSDEYFSRMVDVNNEMAARLTASQVAPIQTAVVNMPDLTANGRPMAVASVLSRSRSNRVYLVLVNQTEPRRELSDVEEIKGAMRLIAALRNTGLDVIVGFCSSDMLLWKSAGAAHCATGKFFNLRRFTRTRFEEPKGQGGGQLPYWFEESLLGFIRQSDLIRIRGLDLQRLPSTPNPFGTAIVEQLAGDPSKAWLALAWRQFMFWFADAEMRLDTRATNASTLLRNADANWRTLDDVDFLMEERRNDGAWVRLWRRALNEFRSSDNRS